MNDEHIQECMLSSRSSTGTGLIGRIKCFFGFHWWGVVKWSHIRQPYQDCGRRGCDMRRWL